MSTTTKVLIVDDEPAIRKLVRVGLGSQGYAILEAGTARDAVALVKAERPDVILLDLGLPDMPGELFLQQLRGAKNGTPVIVLTARDQIRDRVNALDLGADDYLVKPIDLDELGARLRAVRRRVSPTNDASNVQVHGPLELEQGSRTVRWCGAEVMLTGKEFDVLEALLMRRPRVVSRKQIEDVLYGWGDEIESNAIEVYVHFLRRKFTPGLIVTVRGKGYQIGNEDVLRAEAARKARQAS